MDDEGTVTTTILVVGALVVRKWLIASKLRMAQCLMVAALVMMVLRRMEAARLQMCSCGWGLGANLS